MLKFRSIYEEPISYFRRYYERSGVCICDKTVTCKRMWEGFNAYWTEVCGCLVIKNESAFWGTAFDFPLKGENGDVEGALKAIEDYCAEKGLKLKFCCLSAEEQMILASRYSHFECVNDRNYRDYIYLREDMSTFKGKKYSGQRNHINKFRLLYPQAVYRSLVNGDREKVTEFLSEWEKTVLPEKGAGSASEFKKSEKLLSSLNYEEYKTGCVEVEGKIIGICIGEEAFDTVVIHIEKYLYGYEGAGVFMVREFAAANKKTYINREDDSATEGLRISKTQYHPLRIEPEFVMRVGNETDRLKRIPTIKSERLTLGEIKKADIKEYYRLCTDEELNKYWGYDYRKDLEWELYESYFYDVAKNDFKTRNGVNFAIRKDGKFIGETVIYELNFRGECKIGVRILPEYGGHGYGKEAFERTVKYALYGLGIKKVISSCYKENEASVKMHEKLMRKTGEDKERYYYEREY